MKKLYLHSLVIIALFCIAEAAQDNHEQNLESPLKSTLLREVPHTPEGIEILVTKSRKTWEENVQAFLSACVDRKPLAQTIEAWNRIGHDYLTTLSFLKIIGIYIKDNELEVATHAGMGTLQGALTTFLEQYNAREVFFSYLEEMQASGDLDSTTSNIHLEAFVKDQACLSLQEKKRFALLIGSLDQESLPFKVAQGDASYKPEPSSRISLMSWNICGFPQAIPLFVGGVLPFEMRSTRIIDVIRKADPDVICLQEVFDPTVAETLYQGLKDRYVDFYLSIPPSRFGFSPTNISLCSGLFVASKIPLNECEWHPFRHTQYPNMKRGFFCFDVVNQERPIRIIATHLESCQDDPMLPCPSREYRHAQLNEILRHIEHQTGKHSPLSKPYVLCGDLNVYWGDGEASEKVLKRCFEDSYNKNRKTCTFKDCTQTDLTGYWWPKYNLNVNGRYDPKPWIIDYVLLLKMMPSGGKITKKCSLRTVRLPVGDPYLPAQALSDHHPLLSTLTWP